MPEPLPIRRVASPCIAAFCATCGHAHTGQTCDYQVARLVDDHQEHDACGCQEFVKEVPTRCAFSCDCDSPSCDCDEHCKRHADAIITHREDTDHELHDLALTAHHPHD